MQQDIMVPKSSGNIPQVSTPIEVAIPSDGAPSLSQQAQDVKPAPQLKNAVDKNKTNTTPSIKGQKPEQQLEKSTTKAQHDQNEVKPGSPITAILLAVSTACVLIGLAVFMQLNAN